LNPDIASEVARALAEDIGPGDVSAALVPAAQRALATLITRDPIVLCGTAWVDETFRQLDPSIAVRWNMRDGEEPSAKRATAHHRYRPRTPPNDRRQ
jgi:nicotinate-nucleotide pyrophosphorylase (carboxylating)